MIAKCFLKHGIPFQYDPNIEMLERVNLIKVKFIDQRFELRYKSKKKDYRWVASVRRERRMARIKGTKPKEKELVILPVRVSSPKVAYVMQLNKGLESLKTLNYKHKHLGGG